MFPATFDPVEAGLALVVSPIGDLNANNALDANDVDMLASRLRGHDVSPSWLTDEIFDVNADGTVDHEDHRIWVKDLKHTWFGDANLDLEFSSSDMVQVFAAGKYETEEYAGWADGDWNGDGLFDSSDMVAAFADGGYEKGQRVDAMAVPEPGGCTLLMVGLLPWLFGGRSRWFVKELSINRSDANPEVCRKRLAHLPSEGANLGIWGSPFGVKCKRAVRGYRNTTTA